MRKIGSVWRILLITLGGAIPSWCVAEDVYAARFFARSEPGCFRILWEDDLVFHNSSAEDQLVRLLGVSNGDLPEVAPLRVPAGRTVSVRENANWSPQVPVPLWIVHLDVPPGVTIHSRAEAHSDSCTGGVPPSPSPDLGTFSLPIFRTLTAAGVRKVHLGADLGSENSYVNVGVFNAASVPASARIELRQACDDSILEQRTIGVPPNSIVQVAGLQGTPSGCPATRGTWLRYVTVTVDQPSLSYVVNKKSELSPPVAVPYNSPH